MTTMLTARVVSGKTMNIISLLRGSYCDVMEGLSIYLVLFVLRVAHKGLNQSPLTVSIS